MMISCEECGKTYSIDVLKMRKERLQTRCTQCGHLMTIYRNGKPEGGTAAGALSGASAVKPAGATPDVLEGENNRWYQRLGFKLIATFLSCILLIGVTFSFIYVKQISPIIAHQVDLRGASLSKSLGNSVLQPLLLRNYLNVNQIAKMSAELPGIAYVSVLNHRGILVSGILSDPARFSEAFQEDYRRNGFPVDVMEQNALLPEATESAKNVTLGGQRIHDVAVQIGDSTGTIHVGIFLDEIEREVRSGLIPLVMLLIVLSVAGSIGFVVIARNIVRPIKELAQTARRIGLGEIDDPVEVKGTGEIEELSKSLEMMRLSIKSAIYRLRGRSAGIA